MSSKQLDAGPTASCTYDYNGNALTMVNSSGTTTNTVIMASAATYPYVKQ